MALTDEILATLASTDFHSMSYEPTERFGVKSFYFSSSISFEEESKVR